jgi:tripartite-type tricarboxylate transporter receptor subunit TctC
MKRFVAAILVTAAIAAGQAIAQDYPSRTVRFMIGFAPGGSSDLVSRALAERLSPRLGQPVVPEQRQGASGVIANEAVAKAPPDGHMLVLLTGGHPVAAVLMRKLPYDPVKDFAMVSTVTSYPMFITVAPDSAMKTLPDMLAKAKANPDRVTFADSGPGSLHHMVGQLVAVEGGVSLVSVPFKGAAQAIIDLLGGRIDSMVETATFSLPQVRAGKMRALAVSSASRYPLLPGVPTIAETLPGVEAGSWLGVATSPGTPAPVVDRLNREIRVVLQSPEMSKRLGDLGGVPTPSTPEEMRTRIEREIAKWARIAKLKNIQPTN